jgi:hypothetical protein
MRTFEKICKCGKYGQFINSGTGKISDNADADVDADMVDIIDTNKALRQAT